MDSVGALTLVGRWSSIQFLKFVVNQQTLICFNHPLLAHQLFWLYMFMGIEDSIAKMTTPYSLGSRRFVHIENGEDQIASVEPTTCISVLQYNVLADAAIPKGDSGANINGSLSYCPESHRYMQSEF